MTEVLDTEICTKLGILIETICHSGLKILDEGSFKEVKKICKQSPGYIKKTYELLIHQLKKKHSEVRLSAFQMCTELFKKSHVFRELVIKDLKFIFKLIAEIDSKTPLPPPKSASDALKTLAITTMQNWTNEFGETYKQLQVAYNYFKHCKKVDFLALQVRNSAEEAAALHRQKLIENQNKEKMRKLEKEIGENEFEIESAITTLSNCISLLLPTPENFFLTEKDEEEFTSCGNDFHHAEEELSSESEASECDDNIHLRQHGINPKFNLSLTLNLDQKISVPKTSENSSIIENAEDTVRLIQLRLLPMIKNWSQICVKHSGNETDVFKKVMDFKGQLEKCVEKYKNLNIEGVGKSDENDSSEDDFEEVKKEGYEDSVKEYDILPIANHVFSAPKKPETQWGISIGTDDKDPTSALPTLKQLKNSETNFPSSSSTSDLAIASTSSLGSSSKASSTVSNRKRKLLAAAPKLPFDIDLYHWEDENLTAPTLLSVKMDNPKFWSASGVDDMDEIPNPEGIAALRTRVIEFSGSFQPVKWSCRAPLGKGKLCPRKDRVKCPFHGKIVARDEKGKCKNPEDEETLKKVQVQGEEEAVPDWQDPKLLADLKKATGIDLRMPDKKKKRKKKDRIKNETYKKMKTSSATLKEIEKRNFPGVMDIVAKQNNCYRRLSKKIFNRSSLNRVAANINKLEHKKFRDKFGDQFNYIYETS